ncbi:unnamed protein product [Urochloa decumbens]|uniref:Auxin-responsive protein n=1 Tax=Urochloa decumbens TaxID=240449 RepID=A0ABC8YLE3_9POAL
MEMIDAELRLGPPGGGDVTVVQPARKPAPAKRSSSAVKSEASGTGGHDDDAAPASKVQVVGWPPVRAYRKNAFQTVAEAASERKTTKKKGEQQGGGLYVKVSMDGAPYLRKVDLRTYGGYRELRDALDALFGCFSSSSASAADGGCQFAIAYEDKDGDLMLAGDVPWDMFICSCKKLRIMRGSEAR